MNKLVVVTGALSLMVITTYTALRSAELTRVQTRQTKATDNNPDQDITRLQTSSPNKILNRQWHLLAKRSLIAIHVERVLYHTPKSRHFFVRVRMTNLAQQPIGVELDNYSRMIHPNQWGMSQTPYRGVIDETRIVPEMLDETRKAKLKAAYAANKLTIIPVGRSVDYYRDFNASGPENIKASKGKFFIISMDGQLLLTNGKVVEDVSCDSHRTTIESDVVMRFPVKWKTIQSGAKVFFDRRR